MPARRPDYNATIDPGLIQSLWQHLRLCWRLMGDSRVPTGLKVALPLAAVLYIVLPIDLLPDVLPVLGQVDDLGLLVLALTLFARLAPAVVVAEHRRAMAGHPPADEATEEPEEVIDVKFRANDQSSGRARR